MNILVLYHSETGSTEKLAQEIGQGINNYPGAKAVLKKVSDFKVEDLPNYDGIAFGTPIYFASMSGKMKTFLDGSLELWKKRSLEGKPALVFTTGGSGSGTETTILSVWSVLASHGMILMPKMGSGNLGISSTTANEFDPAQARLQGESLAKLASAIKASHEIKLPEAPKPVGNYKPYKITGKYIYINQIALSEGKVLNPGVIGESVTMEEAKESTRQTALNILAVLKDALKGKMSEVKQLVQLTGHFNTTSTFKEHAVLMNEASDVVIKILGDRGEHTRATFGASSLPLGSPVEIQAIFELK